jgi:mannitol-1-phosphate/altronate dehydrogenase
MPYIDQTMNDAVFRQGTAALMNNETGPTLPEVPGVDIPAYKAEIIDRFANAAVQDTTWRVAKDAPLQVVLDSARDQLTAGGSYELLALNTAAWMRRFRVESNETGGIVDAVHPQVALIKAKAEEGVNNPAPMFSITDVFGDIGQHADFVSAVGSYMEMLDTQGVRATITAAIAASQQALIRSAGPSGRPKSGRPLNPQNG